MVGSRRETLSLIENINRYRRACYGSARVWWSSILVFQLWQKLQVPVNPVHTSQVRVPEGTSVSVPVLSVQSKAKRKLPKTCCCETSGQNYKWILNCNFTTEQFLKKHDFIVLFECFSFYQLYSV